MMGWQNQWAKEIEENFTDIPPEAAFEKPKRRRRVRREREAERRKVHEFLFGTKKREAFKLAGTAGLPDRMMVDQEGLRTAALVLRSQVQSGRMITPEEAEARVREIIAYVIWFVEHKAKLGCAEPRQKRVLPFLREAGLTVLEARDLG